MKIDVDVIGEAERLAQAARVTLDAFITQALRHYNRFHALTKTNHVRWARGKRLAFLFPDKSAPAPPPPVQLARKPRRRSSTKRG